MRKLIFLLLTGCVVEADTHRGTADGSDTGSPTGTDAGGDSGETGPVDESACEGSEPVLDLTCGTITSAIAVDTHADDHFAYSCNEYGDGYDQMYRFVCPGTGDVGFLMRPDCDLDLVLLDAGCDLGDGCLEASVAGDASNELVVASCTPGTVFHLSVEAYGVGEADMCGDVGNFELQVSGDGC